MIRAAIFSWSAMMLLAGGAARWLDYRTFADAAMELAVIGLIVGLLFQVIAGAAAVLRQSRPPAP